MFRGDSKETCSVIKNTTRRFLVRIERFSCKQQQGGAGVYDAAGRAEKTGAALAVCDTLVDSPVVARWGSRGDGDIIEIASVPVQNKMSIPAAARTKVWKNVLGGIDPTKGELTVGGAGSAAWIVRNADGVRRDGALSGEIVDNGRDTGCIRDRALGEIDGTDTDTVLLVEPRDRWDTRKSGLTLGYHRRR